MTTPSKNSPVQGQGHEIEDVVMGMPDVPDSYADEAVTLIIVKKNPALTPKTVRDYRRQQLTGGKQPKVVEFRTELPKTLVGKILRREWRGEG